MAAKAACTTLISSFSGGIVAIFYSFYATNGKLDILMLINGILGGLVGVTGATEKSSKLLSQTGDI